MNEKYTETAVLRTCHCDMYGDWRPSSILEFMQETAGTHCALLGIGRDVTDRLGVVWVLSRAKVALTRVPRMGERVDVETCPLPPKHLFYPRVNRFIDERGEVIGRANSLWVLLDVAARRIVNSDEVLRHLPDNSAVDPGIGMPATVRPLPGEALRQRFVPGFADYDLNGHVNNTRYLDWCCNALGHEALRDGRLAAFDINYDSEILPDAHIDTELVRDGRKFTFCGSENGKRRFAISGALTERDR